MSVVSQATGRPEVGKKPAQSGVNLMHSRALGWLLIGTIFVLWEVGRRLGVISSANLPPPSEIVEAFRDLFWGGNGFQHLGVTVMRVFCGYGLAIIVGVALGMAMGTWRTVDSLLEPAIELLRPVPVTALVPLAILFVGIGNELKIIIAFIGAFFPILINTYAGTRSVSSTLRETAATFRLTTQQRIVHIVLPAAAPSIFVGFRLGLTITFVVTVVCEMIAGNTGLGYYILHSQQMMLMPELYAGVLALALTGYLLNFAFLGVEKRILFWSDRIRHQQIA